MEKREQMKLQFLKRTLVHVPFEGWNQGVIDRSAVEALGEASYGWRLFPKGPLEVVAYWSQQLDDEMLDILSASNEMRIRDKVTLAVRTRLQLLSPHREAARRTVKYLAFPPHAGEGTRLLYQTVNKIWYYAGDSSTDYNFYTKRALLAWVYSSTFLYWLRDESEDFENTWAFLDRRIEEVLTLPQLPKKILSSLFPWKSHG